MTTSTAVDSLAEALVEANDLLLGLYDLSDVTGRSLDESQVVQDILERAIRIVRADTLELSTATCHVTVWRDGDAASVDDAQATSVTAIHGLDLAGRLDATRAIAPFSTGDRKLLTAVLRTTLAAVETARLHQHALETALDARENQRAAEVAQLALPIERPDPDDVDTFFTTDQAQVTGGDLFCFRVDGDTVSFAVGDVSGKGLSAAVMMTTAVCATRAAFRDSRCASPGQELRQVNEWMYDHLSDAGLFVTMFIGHYRQPTNELCWANAGQSPCLIGRKGSAEDLPATTPPLGILSTIDDRTETSALDANDIVLIGSDGIVEQQATTGDTFGESRLRAVLADLRGNDAATVGTGLLTAVTEFADGRPQSDDRTVAVVRHRGARRS